MPCAIDPNGVDSRSTCRRFTMASQPIEDAVELLRVEYLEMPDLALTPSQVAALLDLDGVTAAAVLRALEDSRFLERTPNGRFIHPKVTILT
jgi:DNA-binding IclR family transcriptional regulator